MFIQQSFRTAKKEKADAPVWERLRGKCGAANFCSPLTTVAILKRHEVSAKAERLREILLRPPAKRTDEDIFHVLRILSKKGFMASLPFEERLALCREAFYGKHEAGKVLCQHGSPCDMYYVVLEGEVSLRRPEPDEKEVFFAHESAFGDHGLQLEALPLDGVPWPYTLTAAQSTQCLQISRDSVQKVVVRKDFEKENLADVLRVLQRVPMFWDFRLETLELMTSVVRSKEYPANSVLYRQGSSPGECFIIKSGLVRFLRRVDIPEEVLGRRWFMMSRRMLQEEQRYNDVLRGTESHARLRPGHEDGVVSIERQGTGNSPAGEQAGFGNQRSVR
eukprot:evm.model.scf_1509.3 EVM.evm.TU.scf_1509.3   scf_1509:12338-17408(+)